MSYNPQYCVRLPNDTATKLYQLEEKYGFKYVGICRQLAYIITALEPNAINLLSLNTRAMPDVLLQWRQDLKLNRQQRRILEILNKGN